MRRLLTIVRLVGPHPITLARTLAFVLERKRRQTVLRRSLEGHAAEHTPKLRLRSIEIGPAANLPEPLRAAAERLRLEANDIMEHRVSYLGSGLVELGTMIDWHRDFKSGYRWPESFYKDVRATRLDDASDAKVPWELSRGHQLLTLARAAALFEEHRYAVELERQLGDWIDRNPPHVGINWVNPMEVGLRAVNWLWALSTMPGGPSPELTDRVATSLVAHGRHIWANLEGTPHLRSNHYIADILGLLAIGAALPHHAEAARWVSFARLELDTEIHRQVFSDGVSFEGSLAYHGLALEMFLFARVIAMEAAAPLPQHFDNRLTKMLDVSRAVRHRNGRIPLFGDQDSGRVLPAGFARPPTHDNLLWLGTAILDLPRPLNGDPDEEVAWTLGTGVWRRVAATSGTAPASPGVFDIGRIYCFDSARTHLVLTCGDLGQNGNGGHGHNDTFSFELSSDGVPIVVDSGTYAYTFDVAARNAFRSTAAHNAIEVDGQEINPIDPTRVFELAQVASISVEEWTSTPDSVVFKGSHDGYARLGVPSHRRIVHLDRQTDAVKIIDRVSGNGAHRAVARLHLAAGTSVDLTDTDAIVACDGARLTVSFEGVDQVQIVDGAVSDSYGARASAPILQALVERPLPLELSINLLPARVTE